MRKPFLVILSIIFELGQLTTSRAAQSSLQAAIPVDGIFDQKLTIPDLKNSLISKLPKDISAIFDSILPHVPVSTEVEIQKVGEQRFLILVLRGQGEVLRETQLEIQDPIKGIFKINGHSFKMHKSKDVQRALTEVVKLSSLPMKKDKWSLLSPLLIPTAHADFMETVKENWPAFLIGGLVLGLGFLLWNNSNCNNYNNLASQCGPGGLYSGPNAGAFVNNVSSSNNFLFGLTPAFGCSSSVSMATNCAAQTQNLMSQLYTQQIQTVAPMQTRLMSPVSSFNPIPLKAGPYSIRAPTNSLKVQGSDARPTVINKAGSGGAR